MSSFFTKITDAVGDVGGTVKKGLGHARNELIGRFDADRRHDDPHEIEADNLRAEILRGHRYESFAQERAQNFVKWHIDGHDFMWAVSEMIDKAKEAIFILDWWLTPEIYLRRPPAAHPEWRLDKLLARKAEEGVHVYIIVYKEVTQTMAMCSSHTKNYLESLHPGIVVLRHPDHIGSKDSVQFWSHHEKLVVVDNHYASVGGLDLCFGRWDTHTHPLADSHPTDFSQTLFPGQDYNNARVMDFQNVWSYAGNELSILETPRMPWHDVHMTLTGPSVLDLVQHFVERWNQIKHRKYRDEERVPILALPHDVEAAPNEAVARHPEREGWHETGRKYRHMWHRQESQEGDHEVPHPHHATCKVQVVRSVSDWSHGLLVEHSIQTAYIKLIEESQHFIYIENQFFITATEEGGLVKNLIGKALVDRIVRAAKEGKKFKVFVAIPEVPGFPGQIKADNSIKTIMAAQYRSINRGGSSIYEKIRAAGFEPLDYIRFFHLRSYDRINAPMGTYIKQAEEKSGVTFHAAQVALAREWIGPQTLEELKTVTVKVAEPVTDGLTAGSDKTDKPAKTEAVPVPQTVEEAREIIDRFESAAKEIRGDEGVSDTVSQHLLADSTGLLQEQWFGTDEEERAAYVSELLYIHTKLMVVDDRKVIMGSANINDRSQKGDGDSEIALVVEDGDMVDSTMDGEPYQVSRFAASLRRKLFREHLGLVKPQGGDQLLPLEATSFMRPAPFPNDVEFGEREDDLVADPLSDDMIELWYRTARNNREIFAEIFKPVPTNLVRTWAAYDSYVPTVKPGHVVPDMPLDRIKHRLSEVRGALVESPLDFLIDEKDFVNGGAWSGVDLPTLPIFI